jgi:N-acyl-D-aspartate/D-glutamate deacylase/predicted ester cyclase
MREVQHMKSAVRLLTILIVVVAFVSTPSARPQGQARYDLLIRNGRIVDGTGAPWYRADVAVRDGRIVAIGRLSEARGARTIDATGLVVAPGFIDMMGQTAASFLQEHHSAVNLLTQGITTINCGEGRSDAPLSEVEGRRFGWRTMREFFALLEKNRLPMNMVQTVGATQVRAIVVGLEDKRATPEQLERMKTLVREAMEAGAIGLSTSLIYPPAVYAPEEEITELAKVAGEYGGRYYTHMRNEGDQLLEAIDEALRIGKAASTPVHIFHLKTAGRANWGKMDLAIARIKAARAAGQEVGADIYPYINNGLFIRALIHPRHSAKGPEELLRRLDDPQMRAEIRREMETGTGWENWFAHVGHDWDRIVIAGNENPAFAAHNGKTLGEIARAMNRDPWDLFFAIARAGAFAMPQSMSEANKIKAMKQDFVSFDTDAGPAPSSERSSQRGPGGSTRAAVISHPRAFGSFPRVLSRYVRELGALTLEEAIQRMTAVAANEIMAYDRGRLAAGLAADIVLFDPNTIRDRATFSQPDAVSEGMKYVIVNGQIVIEDGKFTGATPGRVLRGPGFRAERLTGSPNVPSDHQKVVLSYFHDVLDGRNLGLLEKLFLPDCVIYRPEGIVKGMAGIRGVVERNYAAYSKFETEVQDIFESGDRVVVRITHRAMGAGVFRSRIGTHDVKDKPVTWSAIAIFRMQNGKIAEEWVNRDELGILLGLGVLKPSSAVR